MDYIPVNEPLLDGNEKKYLCECIDAGWISSEGPFVRELEERFAARVGRQYGVSLCNGSAALDVAVAALKIGAGDEVILPAFTIISCAAAVVRAGAVPVLVDCDPATWNMETGQIEARITSRTKAIMVVHIYGLSVDMAPVQVLAKKHGLFIIEDAAEAHGLTCRGRPCGSFGEISTFSFYPNKLVSTGEGGMVLTDDTALADRCRSLRNLCFQAGRRFYHEELGWNFRLSNLQAAVGLAQLERIDDFIARKRRMGRRYRALLEDLPGLHQPLAATVWAENIYWVYGLCLKDDVPLDAAQVMNRLGKLGIATRPFFWPLHEQPVFRKLGLFIGESYPVSERLARRGFYLPSGLALTEDQMDRVAAAVHQVLK
jgi:perosamine synthetase